MHVEVKNMICGMKLVVYASVHTKTNQLQFKPQSEIQMGSQLISSKSSPIKTILVLSSILCIVYLFVSVSVIHSSTFDNILWSRRSKFVDVSEATSIDQVFFGIASSFKSWTRRKESVRLWWKPEQMRGCVFLDKSIPDQNDNYTLPPFCMSGDTAHFPYSFRGGDRSALRIARVVSDAVNLNHSDVRWFVFGDDDTVFFPENIAKTLSKYDHNQWYYIGSVSETFIQNDDDLSSFEMGYGGGGFALSYPLAKVLAKVLDSCLERHPHLYGSDARIYSCLAELGIGLTHELGFHQVDIRGDLFGLLASHPLAPLLSLHHMDFIDPIFPGKNRIQALQHLFKAVALDPLRILQQTVCYNKKFKWTISISWGYAIQVFETNVQLRDLLPVQKTFMPWRKKEVPHSKLYMFNTRELPSDPCQRPTIFFMDSLSSNNTDNQAIKSIYRRNIPAQCLEKKRSSKTLEEIRVFSHKLDLDGKQLQSLRRDCCDVLPSSSNDKVLDITIRECGEEEITFMSP